MSMEGPKNPSRRDILKGAAAVGIALGLHGDTKSEVQSEDMKGLESRRTRSERLPAAPETADDIVSPYAEKVLDMYCKQFNIEPSDKKRELANEILRTFLRETVENTQMFRSEKFGVSFPWSVIDTGALAKKLNGVATPSPEGGTPKRREFIFGSFLYPMHGMPFTYQEE